MSILVQNAGFLTTIQDAGRFGYEKFGIPCSGPMDRFALYAANRLVGNPTGAAGLEFGISGPEFVLGDDCVIAAAGCGYELRINSDPMPLWMSIFARRGDDIQFIRAGEGSWGCLAVSGGGIASPLLMGSRATYLKGKIGGYGGAVLRNGDLLPTFPQPEAVRLTAGHCLPPAYRPLYGPARPIRVILGPQEERFTAAGLETFLNSTYSISPASDRMGYRLEGAKIEHTGGADMLSDGMAFGSIQVPASGQPIVMMSEHPTTGGYTKIATVISADLPLLAQRTPGVDPVCFAAVTVEEARQEYRALMKNMEIYLRGEEYLESDDIQ